MKYIKVKGKKKIKIGLAKYPEFKELANDLADEVLRKINKEAKKIESEMPYKSQFVLEEVIKILEDRV